MDAKQMVDDFMQTAKQLGEFDKGYIDAVMGLIKEAEKPGALSTKEKELISIALGIAAHCAYCIALHVKNAIDAGATRAEILEAAEVAGLMGGGPSIAYIRLVLDALEQFGAK
ncbi:carboxymuconolactone decarboxylase family protein [Caldisericum exile]|uniref:Carboxymuconolactone decarboxylase family protein n=1 Tax=Caldisericum exile (strain DSM 21853 / NBRC 104410 / AZM16c01) TaxID=511051 RepID=A0A7U6GDR3_CALEA|nr:carboxymuconolactone decarboxylase family protein [Caldisericum exile]BAL80528.1 carboxymuconolactone decarboxylase family protein [Caldisericum exile AZM16c01]